MTPFKNARCQQVDPSRGYEFSYSPLDFCQRNKRHIGEHRSRTRWWDEGDRESRPRSQPRKVPA